jgi:alpha-1,2-mannosyltransferase
VIRTKTEHHRWAILWLVVAVVVLASVVIPLAGIGMLIDLEVYRMGGRAVVDGHDLYELHFRVAGLAFTYSPFAALVFVPFGLLGSGVAAVVWTTLSLAALGRSCLLVAREAPGARPRSWSAGQAALALFALALLLEPVRKTTGLGQINLFIVWLVLEDLLGRGRSAWRGALIGIATGIKLTPGVFVVYLLLVRRGADALRAAVAAAATVAIGFVFLPSASWTYWTDLFFDADRVGGIAYVSNQSVTGVVERLAGPGERPEVLVVVLSATALVAGFALGRRLWLRGDRLLGISAVAVGALLASPVSWSHHWCWFLVAAVGLADRCRIGRSSPDRGAVAMLVVTVVVALSSIIWRVPNERDQEYHHAGWELIAGNAYFLWALLFLAYSAGVTLLGAADARAEVDDGTGLVDGRTAPPGLPG